MLYEYIRQVESKRLSIDERLRALAQAIVIIHQDMKKQKIENKNDIALIRAEIERGGMI